MLNKLLETHIERKKYIKSGLYYFYAFDELYLDDDFYVWFYCLDDDFKLKYNKDNFSKYIEYENY